MSGILRLLSTQLGNVPILCTGDKDSKAYSGLSLFNPDKPETGVQIIPNLGVILEDEKGKVRANGMKQYGLQMLVGDSVDGFKPTELCRVKFGEKSAMKLLEPCKTEKEVLEVVVQQYQEWYPTPFEYTAWNGAKNVGIGTLTPNASALLDLSSTTKGLSIPTMTSTQASAIASTKKSMMIYVTDTNGTFTSAGWWGYNGTIWKLILAE